LMRANQQPARAAKVRTPSAWRLFAKGLVQIACQAGTESLWLSNEPPVTSASMAAAIAREDLFFTIFFSAASILSVTLVLRSAGDE
jgi:hypothetical protein